MTNKLDQRKELLKCNIIEFFERGGNDKLNVKKCKKQEKGKQLN